MKQPYQHDRAHYNESFSLERTHQLNKLSIGFNRCLCPFCLRPTSRTRQGAARSMQAHHMSYRPTRVVAACSHCHLGRNGDRQRSKCHRRSVWRQFGNPDHNRNTWSFMLAAYLRLWVGYGIAAIVRKLKGNPVNR